MIPAWVEQYIGLAYINKGRGLAGGDCWNLVRLPYIERGIELPSYADGYLASNDRASVAGIIERECRAWCWTRLDARAAARDLDVVILNIGGKPCHCGLYVAGGFLLHTFPGTAACLERLDGARWRNRIEGIYRHAHAPA